jgi:hypothetical protein
MNAARVSDENLTRAVRLKPVAETLVTIGQSSVTVGA